MKVSVYEAKSKLSQMINRALEGEEVIITRNGEETVKLVKADRKKNDDWIGMYDGQITIGDDFDAPLEEFDYFNGEAETFLDQVLSRERRLDDDAK